MSYSCRDQWMFHRSLQSLNVQAHRDSLVSTCTRVLFQHREVTYESNGVATWLTLKWQAKAELMKTCSIKELETQCAPTGYKPCFFNQSTGDAPCTASFQWCQNFPRMRPVWARASTESGWSHFKVMKINCQHSDNENRARRVMHSNSTHQFN